MSEEIIQRTEEWYAIRLGKATASRVADIIAKTKSGPSASRRNYLAELACERLTGQKAESYTNGAMQWGIDHEKEARELYSAQTFSDVAETGFVDHPSIPMSGCSPDGLIDNDGLIEIKCPNTATHIDTLMSGEADKKYFAQMQMQMACTGRKWCDFVSYDPRLSPNCRIFIKRVHRDDAFIAEMETEITKFLSEVSETVEKLLHYGEAETPKEPETPKKTRSRKAA